MTTVHILTFARYQCDLSNDQVDSLRTRADKDILGIWKGQCIEEPELTMVIIAGFSDNLDSKSFLGIIPKEQERTNMPFPELATCLKAPVTEVAITTLKQGCDHARATAIINAAMQTVLEAHGCTSAIWRTNRDKTIFFVGWDFLEAHQQYHQKIFANPPDCIKELPKIVESSRVLHFRLDAR